MVALLGKKSEKWTKDPEIPKQAIAERDGASSSVRLGMEKPLLDPVAAVPEEETRDWANLMPDLVDEISGRLMFSLGPGRVPPLPRRVQAVARALGRPAFGRVVRIVDPFSNAISRSSIVAAAPTQATSARCTGIPGPSSQS